MPDQNGPESLSLVKGGDATRLQSGEGPTETEVPVPPDHTRRTGPEGALETEWVDFMDRWAGLVRRYFKWIRCDRQELDELTMDVLSDAYVALQDIPRGGGAEQVVRAMAREASSEQKRLMRRRDRSEVLGDIEDDTEAHEAALRREALWEWLVSLLRGLPEHQRLIIERRLDGVGDVEIAAELGYTVQSVWSLRTRGMRSLRAVAESSPPRRLTRLHWVIQNRVVVWPGAQLGHQMVHKAQYVGMVAASTVVRDASQGYSLAVEPRPWRVGSQAALGFDVCAARTINPPDLEPICRERTGPTPDWSAGTKQFCAERASSHSCRGVIPLLNAPRHRSTWGSRGVPTCALVNPAR